MNQTFIDPKQCVKCSHPITVSHGYKHIKTQSGWYSGNLCVVCASSLRPKIPSAYYYAINRTQYGINKANEPLEEEEEPKERHPK